MRHLRHFDSQSTSHLLLAQPTTRTSRRILLLVHAQAFLGKKIEEIVEKIEGDQGDSSTDGEQRTDLDELSADFTQVSINTQNYKKYH